MNRDEVIDEYLEEHEDLLHHLDNDELFGAEHMDEIRQEHIEALLESYEGELYQKDDDELFGEAAVEKMRTDEIETQLDAERERVEALCDEDLAAIVNEEDDAFMKELQHLGENDNNE